MTVTPILQFIPSGRPEVMARLLRSLRQDHLTGVLDLEDGHWHVRQPQATATARVRAREALLRLAELWAVNRAEGSPQPSLALRVNPVQTVEFARDLAVVQALVEAEALALVLLPKLEAPDHLHQSLRALKPLGVKAAAVVPMLETVQAVRQAEALLQEAGRLGCEAAVYGHYDHCLDAGLWPFPTDDQLAYWEPAGRVMAAAAEAGLRYVHPVPSDLGQGAALENLVGRLRQGCGEHWSIFSAGSSQTAWLLACLTQPSAAPPPLRTSPGLSRSEQRQQALELCRLYEGRQRVQLVCASDRQRQQFVSPHLYAAALQVLEGSADA